MAILWIHVFEAAAEVALGDPIQELKVTYSVSSVSAGSAITGSNRLRRRVRLFSDGDCHVTWSASPTADTNDIPMNAEVVEYFDIEAGHTVAVIQR